MITLSNSFALSSDRNILHKWFFIVAVHFQVLIDQAFNDWPTALWVAFYLNSLNAGITVRLLWDKEGLFLNFF